jgi:hypothetical protein
MLFPALLAAQIPRVAGVFKQADRGAALAPGVLAFVTGPRFSATATVAVGRRPAPVVEYTAAIGEHCVAAVVGRTRETELQITVDGAPANIVYLAFQ